MTLYELTKGAEERIKGGEPDYCLYPLSSPSHYSTRTSYSLHPSIPNTVLYEISKTMSDAYNSNSEIQEKEDKSTPEGWGGAFHLVERL